MRTAQIRLENNEVRTFMQALENMPMEKRTCDYTVWIAYCESLYLVTNVISDTEECFITSADTRGFAKKGMNIDEFLEYLSGVSPFATVQLSAAENLDTELDMQMDEPQDCIGFAIDEVCNDLYVIAG